MSCDSLLSADVITADGECLTASDTKNTDLFWALRGGGGNEQAELQFPRPGENTDAFVHAVFGSHYQRLLAVKRKDDASNLFRLNQNVT